MFTTANLYAIWAIGPQAAQLNYLLPILETNIFENSILFSLLACKSRNQPRFRSIMKKRENGHFWHFQKWAISDILRWKRPFWHFLKNDNFPHFQKRAVFYISILASAQYAALKSGAEMGKITMDKSKQEKQAGDVVNKMFAVLIGISFPLQIYFNVPGKALSEIF